MTATPEPLEEPEEEHFCRSCHAKRMALDVISAGVFNALAAGVNPVEVHEHVGAILDDFFADEDEEVDEMTAETPTAGRA